MNNSVKDKLDERMYNLINLPSIEFMYGSIEFYDEKTIDEGQGGFRYNGLTGEPSKYWVGDEYVIIGYDSTVGSGPDPYILKTDDPNLPVFWLMTDGGDWSNPDLICDKLENFNKIINMLNEYSDYLCDSQLNEELKEEIINKICNIECKDSISDYWKDLLDRAMPFED